MKVAMGGDHGTLTMKKAIFDMLTEEGYDVKDFGTFTEDAVDYPDYGQTVAEAVASGEYERGIVICGTGVGISISANKVRGIRCAHVSDVFTAKATRSHNDSNVLALGSRNTGLGVALEIVNAWMGTEASTEERHRRRVSKISTIEDKYFK
ncbi:MAG: ribose 5-phosphate isomerase B [Eubacteriales bacterium]